jgi:hypothetical protein
MKHRQAIFLLPLLAFFLLSGCASVSTLPQSANEVIFGEGFEGKTGWSAYREIASFKGTTYLMAYEAAKAGLAHAGFSLLKADARMGVVFGEHGITLHDWNIVAGVYLKQRGLEVDVVVLVEGSKDIGFSGDVTGAPWTGRILQGMREYLRKN